MSKDVKQLEKSVDQKGGEFAENQDDKKKNDPNREGKSLMIFEYDNWLRSSLRGVVSSVYFANFIYTLIAMNSLLLMLDEPKLTDRY